MENDNKSLWCITYHITSYDMLSLSASFQRSLDIIALALALAANIVTKSSS